MAIDKFEKTINTIQSALIWFVIAIITACIAVLFLFDVLAGTGTMLYLTGGKEWQSVVISMATTGLLFALMFIGYMMTTESKSKIIASVGKGIFVASGLLYIQDIIFDALLADILRHGTIISNASADTLQWMFRIVIGGISTVGDALAIAMIIGMPVLKTIIREAVQPQESKSTQTTARASGEEIMSKLPKRPTETRPSHYQHPTPKPKPYTASSNTPTERTFHPLSINRDMDDLPDVKVV